MPTWPLAIALLLGGCTSAAPPATGGGAPGAATEPLRRMRFDPRYGRPGDGENAWPNRRERVGQVIRFHDVHLVGAQEALDHQVSQLAEDLPGFAWLGVGRTDGSASGEYSPIFYREDRL